jgi:hypothetical protein
MSLLNLGGMPTWTPCKMPARSHYTRAMPALTGDKQAPLPEGVTPVGRDATCTCDLGWCPNCLGTGREPNPVDGVCFVCAYDERGRATGRIMLPGPHAPRCNLGRDVPPMCGHKECADDYDFATACHQSLALCGTSESIDTIVLHTAQQQVTCDICLFVNRAIRLERAIADRGAKLPWPVVFPYIALYELAQRARRAWAGVRESGWLLDGFNGIDARDEVGRLIRRIGMPDVDWEWCAVVETMRVVSRALRSADFVTGGPAIWPDTQSLKVPVQAKNPMGTSWSLR